MPPKFIEDQYEPLESRTSPADPSTVPIDESVHPFEKSRVLLRVFNYSFRLSTLRYISFLCLGIAVLWPWNCFLSASGYFVQKFGADSSLGKNYSSSMMSVSTLTSVVLNGYLSTLDFTNWKKRILIGNFLIFSIFAILAITELAWPTLHTVGFFGFLMILVFLSSVGTCFQQTGCMALANVHGAKYAQGVMVGQAISGILPSFSLLLSEILYSGDNSQSATGIVVYFFMTSIITLIAGLLMAVCDRFEDDVVVTSFGGEGQDEESATLPKVHVPFMVLFQKLKFIVLSIVIAFLVTLVFPIFASNTTSVNTDSRWTTNEIFIPFIFVVWNSGDFLGRVLCGFDKFVIEGDLKVFLYTVSRFLFIPLFFLCNIDNKKDNAVVKSDFFYIMLQFLFGVTNGHCLSCAFMNVNKYVDDDNEKEAAGGFTTLFLSIGLLLGSLLSYLFVGLVG